ncbi:MAG: hypothetical protein MUE72_11145 [Chitinophagaceae bacterium]|jgi:hypothetical protein|nr:hypothetical protein [Chitinophagaceae bacterium]
MKGLTAIILMLFFFENGHTQVNSKANNSLNTRMYGDITDEKGVGITECYIRIESKKKNIILHYFNLGKKNSFDVSIAKEAEDTLLLLISHVSYIDTTIQITTQGEMPLQITLRSKTSTLGDIKLKSLPTWTRGDTTFFKVDAFKDGGETKLKDIISKMPGFKILESGRLTYNGVTVDKILVEGEEILADKIKMLLNNFPVHVLSTIQAIENQTEKKLLRGLSTDNLLVVNLGLKKEKMLATFGSADGGIGTQHRYSFNPTLFSLYGKTKVGYIGNFNSLANGLGWEQESEFKNKTEAITEKWMLNNQPLQFIRSFETRRFIKNEEYDNRLQINLSPSKKIKLKTEFNFLKDNQRQNSYYESNLYNQNSFIKRIDSNDIYYRPSQLLVKQSFVYEIDSTKEMRLTVNAFNNGSFASTNVKYNWDSDKSNIENSIKNNWSSYSAKGEFTYKLSNIKVLEFISEINTQKIEQRGVGISDSWDAIFSINNGSYNALRQHVKNDFFQLKNNLNYYIRKKRGVINSGININYTSATIHNEGNLLDWESYTYPIIGLSNNTSTYRTTVIEGYLKKSIRTAFSEIASFNINAGLSSASIKENGNTQNFTTPLFRLSVTNSQKIKQRITLFNTVSYNYNQLPIYQLQRQVFPTGINSYRQYAGISKPLSTLVITNNTHWKWPNSISTSGISFQFFKNFFSPINRNGYINFVQSQTDSFTNISTNMYAISSSSSIPSIFFAGLIDIELLLGQSDILLQQDDNVVKGTVKNYYIKLGYKRNWKKKYYLMFSTKYETNAIRLPNQVSATLSPNAIHIISSIKNRYLIKKGMSVELNASLINNNLSTPNYKAFTFIDLSFELKLPDFPFFITIRGENLGNESYYYSLTNSPISQSFYSVPLVKRNLFLGIRYEL